MVNLFSAADCSEISPISKDGVNTIHLAGNAVSVTCDFTTDGGGWTVCVTFHLPPFHVLITI